MIRFVSGKAILDTVWTAVEENRLEAKRPVRKLEYLPDLGQWPWMEAERNGWKLRDTCGVNSTARRDK